LWIYTLMLPSIAKSGWWLSPTFLQQGPWGIGWLRPEQLLGLSGLDNLTHSLFWSLLVNLCAYVGLSLWRAPSRPGGRPGAAVRGCVRAHPRQRPAGRAGVLARPRQGGGPAPPAGALPRVPRSTRLFTDYARARGLEDISA
jgi:hypothetical protein